MFRKKKKVIQPDIVRGLTVPNENNGELISWDEGVVDSLRYLTTRLSREGSFPKRLAILSALRGEGVTFVSRALAAEFAYDTGSSVCWVDLNWWWPSTLPNESNGFNGLAGVLTGDCQTYEAISSTGWDNLDFLSAGILPPQSRPVFARSNNLSLTIENLSQYYDHLILDIPAILATSDAVHLAGLGTACCMVIMEGVTPMEDVKQALDEISHLPILGTVMNQVNHKTPQQIIRLLNI